MKYYLVDHKLGKAPFLFDTVPQLVSKLEELVVRNHGVTRKQYMQNLIDLGYGYDDPQGTIFTNELAKEYHIGVIKNGSFVRCDVHTATEHSRRKEECGD